MNLAAKCLAIFACVLWGSAFAGAKIAFEFMPPITLSGIRFMLAGLLLLPLLLYKKVNIISQIKSNWRFMLLFALSQTFLQYGLFYMGLDKVSAASAAIIIGAGPLFVMVMAHFVMDNDRLSMRKIVSLIIALSGVLFISLTKGGDNNLVDATFYTGVALLVASNLVGSYTNIMVAKYKKELSPILLTMFANFSGGVLLLLVGLGFEPLPSEQLPLAFYGAIVWLAIIPAAGFSIWYSLLQRPSIKVSDLNMWKFVIPVSGCVLSWILLKNESPNVYSVIGIIVITIALRLYQKRGN